VPVKPLFLDVAWNYVEYPGRKEVAREEEEVVEKVREEKVEEERPKVKKGWFGFGR
jgi:signal recognition particle subunit SRP68